MDHEVRSIRSHQWQSSHEGVKNETDESSNIPSARKLFKFGHVAESQLPEGGNLAAEDSGDTATDEEIMLRQLRRRSAPYTFMPKENVKHESEESPYMPGAFPTETHEETPKAEEKVKPEPAPTTAGSDDRTCRICFSPESAEEKLISPCKCRGTSKWIHLGCLNEWRMHSQNSKSFYRCDQCHYEYSFRRTDLANLLLSRYTLLSLTCLAFTFAAFLGGFFVKFGLWLLPPEYLLGRSGWTSHFSFFYTPFDAGTDMLSAASALIPSTPRVWQDIFIIDVWHFLQGLVSLGIIGVVGFMGTGGLFSLRTFHPRRARRQGESMGFAELAFILVILLGCGKVAYSMWKRVRQMVKRRLSDLGERILEVDPDRP